MANLRFSTIFSINILCSFMRHTPDAIIINHFHLETTNSKKKKKETKKEMENNVELLKPPEIYLLLIYRNSNRNLLKQTFRVDIFRH